MTTLQTMLCKLELRVKTFEMLYKRAVLLVYQILRHSSQRFLRYKHQLKILGGHLKWATLPTDKFI